jgi:ankyrin repeat protein/tetratricopeptide (TPR) repeat protein
MGCVLVSFLVTLVLDRLWAGLLYPLVTVALMKVVHLVLTRVRPLARDPHHFAIQESVAIGGLLSVVLAYILGSKLSLRDLLLGGTALGTLALLSLALEQFFVAREKRAARQARVEAEKARRLLEDGDLGNAEEILQEALLTSEMAYGSYHPQVAHIVICLAEVMAGLGQSDACRLLLKRAVEIHEALPEGPELVGALSRYAEHLRQRAETDMALPVASRAVSVSQRVHGQEIPTAKALLALSRLQALSGQDDAAYRSCSTAAGILESRLGRNHRETIRARAMIANRCLALGRTSEGLQLLQELILLRERVVEEGDYDADDLDMMLDLAVALREADPGQAWQAYARAVAVFRSTVGPGYQRAAEILEPLPAYLASDDLPSLEKLYSLMAAGDAYAARQLLRDHSDLALTVDVSGWTPLQWACFFGLTDLVSILVSAGCDPEHGREVDYPALCIAARWGKHRAVADLLSKEVDMNIVCADRSRPLHGAVRSGDQLTFDILVSRKANLEVINRRGWTPLHEAAYLGHRKFVVQLLGEGMDPNLQAEPSLDTPLHAAVRGNSWLATETLLLNKARLDLLNADDDTPEELARELLHERVVAVLEAARTNTLKVS